MIASALMPKKLQFPQPSELSDEVPVAWRSTEHVVQLYNQETSNEAKNLSAKVQEWFKAEGKRLGWGAVEFPLAYPSRSQFAGAVFLKKK